MTFGQSFKKCMGTWPALFQGRASRSEFWWFVLPLIAFYIILFFAAFGLMFAMAGADQANPGLPPVAVFLIIPLQFGAMFFMTAMSIPLLAVTGRRLHDRGMSAWWILIFAIPFIGPFILLVLLVLPGNRGANRFGPSALGEG